MSSARGILGAVLGAATAGIALRVHAVARHRGQSVSSTIADLPQLLADDAARVAKAARLAAQDGRAAVQDARIEFDEQVAAHARRTKGTDG